MLGGDQAGKVVSAALMLPICFRIKETLVEGLD
jgi:hypothetical protein